MTQIKKNAVSFDFQKANAYIPHILLIGLAIGTANFLMYEEHNWFQWLILAFSTCFLIGYSLVCIAVNKVWFQEQLKPKWKLYLFLALGFFIIGCFASEVEHLINSLIFNNVNYQPFSAGKMYLFNGIISLAMGFSFFLNTRFFPNSIQERISNREEFSNQNEPSAETVEAFDPISKIPVKQREGILLIALEDIVYFEAFDNYSFVFDVKGKKMLCDYSLLFLEKRLDKNFLRVHRKYIVNTSHIKQIKPHLNGRFLIEFVQADLEGISSSKGYSTSMRKLIKIE